MAEVLAPELRPDPHFLAELVDLGLPLEVAEGTAPRVAAGVELIEVLGAGELHCLKRLLGAEAADHERDVVRGAGSGAEGLDFLFDELRERRRVQQRLGLLVEEGLVGGPSSLGHEHELVLVALGRVQVDLGREVALGVGLLEHVLRRHLGIAQVGASIRVIDSLRDVRLILPISDHLEPALAHADPSPGVLAAGEDHASSDVCVLEQLERDEAVVVGGLRVLEDVGQGLEMRRAEEMRDVDHGLPGQQAQRLRFHLEVLLTARAVHHRDVVACQFAVRGRVGFVCLVDILVLELNRSSETPPCDP
mmetsp:Transcript_24775/g.58881  ORF Transcript_24775/g.58881 Transcript_24775/m.58881 type:complete len:306 (+) Transcript_24775:1057-1974(+)